MPIKLATEAKTNRMGFFRDFADWVIEALSGFDTEGSDDFEFEDENRQNDEAPKGRQMTEYETYDFDPSQFAGLNNEDFRMLYGDEEIGDEQSNAPSVNIPAEDERDSTLYSIEPDESMEQEKEHESGEAEAEAEVEIEEVDKQEKIKEAEDQENTVDSEAQDDIVDKKDISYEQNNQVEEGHEANKYISEEKEKGGIELEEENHNENEEIKNEDNDVTNPSNENETNESEYKSQNDDEESEKDYYPKKSAQKETLKTFLKSSLNFQERNSLFSSLDEISNLDSFVESKAELDSFYGDGSVDFSNDVSLKGEKHQLEKDYEDYVESKAEEYSPDKLARSKQHYSEEQEESQPDITETVDSYRDPENRSSPLSAQKFRDELREALARLEQKRKELSQKVKEYSSKESEKEIQSTEIPVEEIEEVTKEPEVTIIEPKLESNQTEIVKVAEEQSVQIPSPDNVFQMPNITESAKASSILDYPVTKPLIISLSVLILLILIGVIAQIILKKKQSKKRQESMKVLYTTRTTV